MYNALFVQGQSFSVKIFVRSRSGCQDKGRETIFMGLSGRRFLSPRVSPRLPVLILRPNTSKCLRTLSLSLSLSICLGESSCLATRQRVNKTAINLVRLCKPGSMQKLQTFWKAADLVIQVVYHLQNVSGKSGWKVNGIRRFGSFSRKFTETTKGLKSQSCFFRTEYSNWKFEFHFFKAIFGTGFRSSRSFFG